MTIGHSGRARRPLRAGIIGTGFMGGVHARAVRSAGHLVSRVAGSNPATAAAAADRLGATAPAASVEELIDSAEVDVVHVCTPNATHAEFAEQALAAGKAVVCEKPLATSAAEAERLTISAARAGAVAAVPFVYRFYPTVREVRSRVAAGEAGSLWLLHGSYLQDWLAAAGSPTGGSTRRSAVPRGLRRHRGALVRPGRVRYRPTDHPGRGADRERPSGTRRPDRRHRGRGGGDLRDRPGRDRLGHGQPGDARAEEPALVLLRRHRGQLLLRPRGPRHPGWGPVGEPGRARGPDTLGPAAGAYATLPAGHPQGYADSFTAFVADVYAAVNGEPPDGLPTFADGHRAAVITEAVVAAAKTDSWVEVPA